MKRKGANNTKHFNFGPTESGENQLDESTVSDIFRIYHSTTSIKNSRNAFLSMVLRNPFEVQIPTLDLKNDREMEILIETYWMPWLKDVYDWVKMFGVAPYRFLRVRQTDHYYPQCPPFGTGYITTFVNRKHEQKFKWYWSHTENHEEEKTMHWVFGHDKPTINGNLRSDMNTLLKEFRTEAVLRESLEVGATQAARPVFLFEHHPPKNDSGNDGLTTLENFGERVAGIMQQKKEAMFTQKMRIRTDDLISGLVTSAMANERTRVSHGTGGRKFFSESESDAWERNNMGIMDRAIPLRTDYVYKQTSKPSVLAELEKYSSRLDDLASAAMDFPAELMNPKTGSRASNVQGPLRVVNERIKDFLVFFRTIVKHAFLVSYGSVLQNALDSVVKNARISSRNSSKMDAKNIVDLYVATEIHIEMSVTPLTSYDDLKKMWMDSLIKKDTFAKHASAAQSVPIEDIDIGLWPDKFPKELLVKTTQSKGGSDKIGEPTDKKLKTTTTTTTSNNNNNNNNNSNNRVPLL